MAKKHRTRFTEGWAKELSDHGRCITWTDRELVDRLFGLSKVQYNPVYEEWAHLDKMRSSGRNYLVAEWAKFIEAAADWKLYVTLTGKHGWFQNECRRVWRKLISEIARFGFEQNGEAVWPQTVWVTEANRFRNGSHIHGLVAGQTFSDVELRRLREWTQRNIGYSRLVMYDRSRGAAGYLVKYMLKDGNELNMEAEAPEVDLGYEYCREVKE